MAFEIATNTEAPRFTVLSEYRVYRIGATPSATAVFTECVYDMDGPATVASADDLDADGTREVLHVPALASVTGLVGRKLCFLDSTEIGTIATATAETVNGVPSVAITLSVPPSIADLTAAKVGAVKLMPVGTPVYKRAVGGKEWSINLDGTKGVAMQRMITMLGAIYFVATRAVLAGLGVAKTDAEITAALNSLAANQTNIDGIFAGQGETLEKDRRLGTLHPDIDVSGDAPVMS